MSGITIAGIRFEPLEGVHYAHDYVRIATDIADGRLLELPTIRQLILTDLWFVVYFVMGVPHANHPFVVERCRAVETGPSSGTLDIWFRGAFKSTVITMAETVQYHLRNPEHCTCIFSYKKPAAEDFLDGIRRTYEKEIVKACFPDLMYKKPETESPSWSLQNGITIKRKNQSRKEATIEASGLVEGMLTGKHFERRVYDDVETADLADNPDQLVKCFSRFEMSQNLGTGRDDDIERVIGTFYSHAGPLVQIRDKKTIDGDLMYLPRIVPATHDGTINGLPVLHSEKKFSELKTSGHFNTQQLCDPTPGGLQRLHADMMTDINPEMIPQNLYKFMMIDPAGSDKNGRGDAWAILVVGIEPRVDDIGASGVYVLHAAISPFTDEDAIKEIVRLYCAAGSVRAVGVEKVALSTTEVHVANALRQKGRYISVDNGTLVILRPAGRKKTERIEHALAWPVNNGKVYLSTSVPNQYRERLRMEMAKFPFWHDDGLDALSYFYDMVKDYKFTNEDVVVPEPEFVDADVCW